MVIGARKVKLLDEEHGPLFTALQKVLAEREPDPVKQQIAIELLVASHAMRFNDVKVANKILDGIDKHARQMVIGAVTEGLFPKPPAGAGVNASKVS